MIPRWRITRWLAFMVILAACLPSPSSAVAPPTKLYVGQSARLTAQIPQSWTVDPTGMFDYTGPDGFVFSGPVSSQTLAGACAAVATPSVFDRAATVTTTTWVGHAACRLAGGSRDVPPRRSLCPIRIPSGSSANATPMPR